MFMDAKPTANLFFKQPIVAIRQAANISLKNVTYKRRHPKDSSLPSTPFSDDPKHLVYRFIIDLSHTRGAPPSNARENEDVWDTNAWQPG